MASHRLDVNKAGSTLVSFVCQKCHQPLKLDHSFIDLDDRIFSELKAPLQGSQNGQIDTTIDHPNDVSTETDDEPYLACEPAASRKVVPSPILQDSESGNGFTLLGETGQSHLGNIGHALKVHSELFDILSGESEVDHPLCEVSLSSGMPYLSQKAAGLELLEKLSAETEDAEETEDALDVELQQLKEEEDRLCAHLQAIENERKDIATAVEKEKDQTKQLEAEEKRMYQEYNEYKRQLLEYEEAQRSVDNQLKYAKAQIDKLKKTNVFNATFHIWHSGHFGTINNFRLGRLPSVPVDWNEINAGWGQTVLLLHSLCNKMNLNLERFKLVPFGNHSYIESLTDKSKELPLYGSGGFRFFWDTKFDQAMVAFLDCLQQFKEEVEKGNTGFCLPYKMDKGRIEDTSTGTSYSIKIQFNSEEQWTKALKFMLTNLKWGLAYVSSQFASK
ncbi:hypothetical protein LSH36_874g01079 [Paralvinella palmiformis]|uniref:Beclin-1 n=1 Tax=Paralvinella palmiformis TaxID=53620 RepID=A0AAD9MU60_9ANNE|nr:hypothetical protein LSH36_874g01079 [Paralvinella palmiformis]